MKNQHPTLPDLFLAFAIAVCFAVPGQAQEDVTTGPQQPILRSDVKSNFMRGVTPDTAARASIIRIVGVRGSADGSTNLRLLLLDSTGNQLHWRPNAWVLAADVGCRGEAFTRTTVTRVEEQLSTAPRPQTSAVVLCDNSMMSGTMARDVVRSLRDILPDVAGRDSIGVVLFDHDLFEISPLLPSVATTDKCNPDAVPAAEGLSAVYSACLAGLSMLSDQKQRRVLIVVTTSDDNASVYASTADVVRRATELQTPIYIIRVGQSSRAYPYRYLSAATGGKLYSIAEDAASSVGSIVREILYASIHALNVSLPPNILSTALCEDVWLKIRFSQDSTSPMLYDSLLLPTKERAYRTSPVIVATFGDTTEVGLQAFYPILATMAEQLMTDSTMMVELIGHVSPDIKGNADDRAFERAEFVQSFLVAYGVRKKQITVRSDGSRRPLFYLQLDGAQRLLNNRVEARTLIADDQPYTITVDQVATEEQAGKLADTWKQRGYKAYFEPVVVNRSPTYRIKLWGYRTIAEAQKDANGARKYRPKATIIE